MSKSVVADCQTIIRHRNNSEESLLKYADQSRKAERFNDVWIKARCNSFPAHRLVLGCFSKFFERLFESPMKEQYEGVVTLKDLNDEAVKVLIDYMYTGNITLNQENVLIILAAADYLQINDVCQFCFDYLKSIISVENWFTIFALPHLYKNDSVLAQLYQVCSDNFSAIAESQDFMGLVIQDLISITQNLDRSIVNETSIYETIISWIRHDEANRKNELPNLLFLFNFDKLPSDFLEDVVSDPLIRGNLECLYSVTSAISKQFKEMRLRERGTKLISIGGTATPRKVVEVCNCFGTSSTIYPELPDKMILSRALRLNDFVYCIGGSSRFNLNGKPTNEVYRINLNDAPRKWQKVCSLHEARYLMGAAVFKDCLVVVGGLKDEDKHQTNSGEFYIPALNKWQQISKLSHCRRGHELVSCNQSLYVLGGETDVQLLNSVKRLNNLDGEWEEVESMNTRRAYFATVSYNGMIYAIGGNDKIKNNKWTTSHTVEKFNPVENKWTFVTGLIQARSDHTACLMHDKIFVVGGYDKFCKPIRIIECYDPTTDEWTVAGETKDDLLGHALVTL